MVTTVTTRGDRLNAAVALHIRMACTITVDNG
jgi:hypothetical protein